MKRQRDPKAQQAIDAKEQPSKKQKKQDEEE